MHTTPVSRSILGIDIGGANLKLADSCGNSLSIAFPMWLRWRELGEVLRESLAKFPVASEFAITMTGELADCFENRRAGVNCILDQVAKAFAPESTWVYAIGNRWLTPAAARAAAWDVAASNWHALGVWVGWAQHRGTWTFTEDSSTATPDIGTLDLVVDVGSTTVDIIPMRTLSDGICGPATCARTDRERLQLGQLVYTGVQRTAVAAIVNSLKIDGYICPVMAERFATSDDCYLILGATPPCPDDCDTADGRPRTVACALGRLARMVGEDAQTLSPKTIAGLAEQIVDAQASQVAQAIARNLSSDAAQCTILFAGHGRDLARRSLIKLQSFSGYGTAPAHLTTHWLDDLCSPELSRCAPAIAVASLRKLHNILERSSQSLTGD